MDRECELTGLAWQSLKGQIAENKKGFCPFVIVWHGVGALGYFVLSDEGWLMRTHRMPFRFDAAK